MTNLGATTPSTPLVRTAATTAATRPTTTATTAGGGFLAKAGGCDSAHGAGAPQKLASGTQVAGASGGGANDGVAQLRGGGGTGDMAGLQQALQSIMAMMTELIGALGGRAAGATGGGAIAQPAIAELQYRPVATPTAGSDAAVAGASGGGASSAPQKHSVGGQRGPGQTAQVGQHRPDQTTQVGGQRGPGQTTQVGGQRGPDQKPQVGQGRPLQATQVAGASGAGATTPANTTTSARPTSDTGVGTLVSGGGALPPGKGGTQVGGANGPGQSPAQRPTQSPGQHPGQTPNQTSPIQGGGPGTDTGLPIEGGGPATAAPVAGTVTLSDRDSGDRMILKSASGNEVTMYGDPHVSMKLGGKNIRFDIGSGPGAITLQDGTNITWDTYKKGEGGSTRNLKVFSIDSAGVEFDRSIRTNDGIDTKDLTTTLTDAQLQEFATELYAYKGNISQPLTRSGAVLPTGR